MKYGSIYRILNVVTGKSYIGQTTKTVKSRISSHYCNAKKGIKTKLYYSIRKHGKEAFTWEIISEANNREELNLLEIQWIRDLGTINFGYNQQLGGLNGPLSELTKIKISEKAKGRVATQEAILNMRNAQLGRRHSEETKEKIRISGKGKKKSQEFIDKMKKSRWPVGRIKIKTIKIKKVSIPRKRLIHPNCLAASIKSLLKPCKAVNVNSGIIITFNSIKEAKASGFSPSKISLALNGHSISYKGYVWSFINKENI